MYCFNFLTKKKPKAAGSEAKPTLQQGEVTDPVVDPQSGEGAGQNRTVWPEGTPEPPGGCRGLLPVMEAAQKVVDVLCGYFHRCRDRNGLMDPGIELTIFWSLYAGGTLFYGPGQMMALTWRSHAVVDFSSYYSVCREIATGFSGSDSHIAHIFGHFNLPCESIHQLLQLLHEGPDAMTETSADEFHRWLLLEQSTGAWYTVQGSSCLTQTHGGSRPGDGLADLIFGYIFHKLLQQLKSQLIEDGVWDPAPWTLPCERIKLRTTHQLAKLIVRFYRPS